MQVLLKILILYYLMKVVSYVMFPTETRRVVSVNYGINKSHVLKMLIVKMQTSKAKAILRSRTVLPDASLFAFKGLLPCNADEFCVHSTSIDIHDSTRAKVGVTKFDRGQTLSAICAEFIESLINKM